MEPGPSEYFIATKPPTIESTETLIRRFNEYKLETDFHEGYVVHRTCEWKLFSSNRSWETSKWKDMKRVGKGGFGTVWLQEKEEERGGSGELRAVKIVPRDFLPNADKSQELLALVKLNEYNHLFVKFLGWYENRYHIFLAMEYIELGDLGNFIPWAATEAKEVTRQILEGLEILHWKDICHRDLKPQNILVVCFDPVWIKITDFGVSKQLRNTAARTQTGTSGYVAPEMLGLVPREFRKGFVPHALDIWSLGSLVHELLTSETPFMEPLYDDPESGLETDMTLERETDFKSLRDYCHGCTEFPTDILQQLQVGEEGIAFVKSLLVANPKDRPSAARALQDPWLTGYATAYASDYVAKLKTEFSCLAVDLNFGGKEGVLMRQVGKEDIMRFLPSSANAQISSLVLSAAAKGSSLAFSRLLASPSYDRESVDALTRGKLFQLAAGKTDITKILLQNRIDVGALVGDQTVLDWAVQSGNVNTVKLLLESTSSVGSRPFLLAVKSGNVDMVRVLWGREVEISGGNQIALQAASEGGDVEIAKFLLDNKADVDAIADGRTALQAAAGGGHIDMAKLLLDNKADVNAKPSKNGRTALQAAAEGGHINMAKLLLDNEADVNATPAINNGRTALQAAAKGEHIDMVKLLLDNNANVNAEPASIGGRTALQAAAKGGYIDIVKLLLDNSANVNAEPASIGGRTALQAAAKGGHINIVKLLLDSNANVNAEPVSIGGRTALQAAAKGGHIDIVKLLLGNKADVNAKPSEDDRTALQSAVEGGHIDTAMNNLALTCAEQGRYKEAEELQLQVLEVRQRILGEEHPNTLASMNSLASTHVNQGRHKNGKAYGVKVLFDGITPTVDLVVVHGLNGHQEQTWTSKNNVLWLRDCLPEVVPNIRVLSWGYDSTSFSCQRLYDHAVGLIADLTLHRKDTNTYGRPIIFIAHGVGGVIVKDALIHSNSASKKNLEHHSSIKTSTYGILFFGTPHQGSDAFACSPGILSSKSTNDAISRNIKEYSEYLQKQLRQYNHVSSDFVTKCYYETNKSSSQKKIAVPTSSAIIPGATNVEVFSINSDYGGMVRYKSADDEGFSKVSLCLKSMVGDAREKVLQNWEEWDRLKGARINSVQTTFKIPFEPEYPRNKQFTGRRDLLDKLHQKIEKAQPELAIVVLYGTGGIGKTQIASEYAHTHQSQYQSIFWINAATKESIQLGFRRVAQRLVREHARIAYDTNPNYALIAKNLDIIDAVDEKGVVSPHEDHIQCIIRGMKLWLAKEGNKNWLLIFDNVDDLDNSEIETFVPTTPYGTVIMTSRRTECRYFGTGIVVEEMQEKEGEDLLLKSAGLKEDSIAGDVVRKLGSLPLAIVQAGAYVAVRQMSFTRYLEIYEKCFNDIFKKKPLVWQSGDQTVLTTLEISFHAIKETDERAAELLSLCSFLSNEDICDQMIRRGKRLEEDDITLDGSLGLLFSYSLAQRKGLYDGFYIHPVVHLWAHEHLNESKREQGAKEALELVIRGIDLSGFGGTEELIYQGRILQHIIITAKLINQYLKKGLAGRSVIGYMISAGFYLVNWGRLKEAEAIQLRTLEEIQHCQGEKHPDTLTAMGNLASTYGNQGRYKEAEVLQLQVVEARQHILGKEHPDTLSFMNNLASTYRRQGQHKEAEVLQLQVLEVRQRILGKEHPNTLTSMNNLASTYTHQGRHKEAEVLKLQVLEVRQRILGKEHPDTLMSMDNLASTYTYQGRHKAEVLQLQVLEIRQRILGKEHPDTLTSMNNLAATYTHQGQHKEAEVLGMQGLEVMQRTLGKEHPNTLTSTNNPASSYINQGRYKEAEVLQLQVLEARQRIIGKEHPNTLTSMNNLASTYSHQGRHKEAEVLQLQVVEASQHIQGKEHPNTLTAMDNLASTYSHQGRHKEAEVLQLQVVEASQRILGNEHPTTLQYTNNLAEMRGAAASTGLWGEGQSQNSILEQEDAMIQMAIGLSLHAGNDDLHAGNDDLLAVVNNLAAILGEKHPVTLKVMTSLAKTLSEQERWKEAEELELRIVDVMQNTLGRENRNTLVATASLAVTYMYQGRHEEAEALQLPVVEVLQRTLGKDHEDTLTSMRILAAIYQKQERSREAKELAERVENTDDEMLQEAITMSLRLDDPREEACSERETGLANKCPDKLKTMANQAATHWVLGEWKEAEQLELRVVKSRQMILGKENPSTLIAMTNLAATFSDQGRWKDAEVLEMQVLESRRRILGDEHPDTLTAITNLAGTYTDQGKWTQAQELYAEAAEARERALGKEHHKTLSAVAALATNHWRQGELEKAEKLELMVVKLRRKILGNENPNTITAVGNLAATYASLDKYDEAEKLQQEVLEALTRAKGSKYPETVLAEELVELYRQGGVDRGTNGYESGGNWIT